MRIFSVVFNFLLKIRSYKQSWKKGQTSGEERINKNYWKSFFLNALLFFYWDGNKFCFVGIVGKLGLSVDIWGFYGVFCDYKGFRASLDSFIRTKTFNNS